MIDIIELSKHNIHTYVYCIYIHTCVRTYIHTYIHIWSKQRPYYINFDVCDDCNFFEWTLIWSTQCCRLEAPVSSTAQLTSGRDVKEFWEFVIGTPPVFVRYLAGTPSQICSLARPIVWSRGLHSWDESHGGWPDCEGILSWNVVMYLVLRWKHVERHAFNLWCFNW